MTKRITYNMTCPFCDKECGFYDEHTVTKRRTKQYFHKDCYKANTRRVKK